MFLGYHAATAADSQESPAPSFVFPTGTEFPSYQCDSSSPITQATAVRIRWEDLLSSNALIEKVNDRNSYGADSRLLQKEELARLLKATIKPGVPEPCTAGEEGFFNLWDVDGKHWDETRTLVALGFTINSTSPAEVALGVGCDYAFAVIVNGVPIYARVGYQPCTESSDLVPVDLRTGANQVVVCFQQRQKKKIRSQFANQWISTLNLYKNRSEATAGAALWNSHPLVTPLLHTLAGATLRIAAPYILEVELLDAKGSTVNHGKTANLNGGILWEQSPPRLPFAGYLKAERWTSEPLLIYDEQSGGLEGAVTALIPGEAGTGVDYAWAYRAKHLLKAEFADQRPSSGWKQKLATAVVGAVATNAEGGAGVQKSGGLQLACFESPIDGSTQYFQYFLPKSALPGATTGKKIPLVVVLPTVSDPVRPFLESTAMAGQQEREIWCSVAERFGCALVWPGYNDVDYGGALSCAMLKENIDAFKAQFGATTGKAYLFASCSAGVISTRFAGDPRNNIAGLALYSPGLYRRVSRYTPGIPTELNPPPPRPISLERLAHQLKFVKCATLYDSGMPGHGDEAGLKAFEQEAKAVGVDLTPLHCDVATEYVWGERMKYRLGLFLDWVGKVDARSFDKGLQSAESLSGDEHGDIGDALRGGFYVQRCEQKFESWLLAWDAAYAVWRSGRLPRTEALGNAVPVVIETESVPSISRHLSDLVPPDDADGQYFGAYVSNNDGRLTVTIFASPKAAPPYPVFDPLLDGNCSNVLFKRANDKWQLLSPAPVTSPLPVVMNERVNQRGVYLR